MSATAFVPPVPPSPVREPGLFGFIAAAGRNGIGMWSDAAYQQDTVVVRGFGPSRMLLNAPAAIQHVLVENPGNYRRTPATIRVLWPVAGDGLLLSEGVRWRARRRLIAPALTPRMLPLLVPHLARATAGCIAGLRAEAARGPVDLLAAMQMVTLEAAGRAMFSLEMAQFGTGMRALLTQYADRLGRPQMLDMLLPLRLLTPHDWARRRFRRRWLRLIDAIVAARAAVPADADAPRDLFDLLLAARDADTGAKLSHAELCDEVATLVVAGHETTSLTLFWALLLLAQAPEEQERVAAEVAGCDFGPDAAAATVARLPQTRAVVDEALRLYPPAFTLSRQAIGEDRVGGLVIPARTVLLIAPWVLHRHRKLWDAPEAFVPARFLPGARPPPRFAYLPFGAGPRVCVGAQFALTEATLVLASLIQAFRVERADTRPVLPAPVITTRPDRAPPFRLTPR